MRKKLRNFLFGLLIIAVIVGVYLVIFGSGVLLGPRDKYTSISGDCKLVDSRLTNSEKNQIIDMVEENRLGTLAAFSDCTDYVPTGGEAPGCPADLNGDGWVNVEDLLILLANWHTPFGDINGDNFTNVEDLLELLTAWGECQGNPIGTCDDGTLNQDETDIDCGGLICEPCSNGQSCNVNADCISGFCDNGICQEPPGNFEWVHEALLLSSDGSSGDNLGTSSSISGVAAVVGAPNHNQAGIPDSGSAYVFRFDGNSWNQEQELIRSDAGGEFDQFGYSVSVSGNVAFVGSKLDDSGATDSGSVYVFRFDGNSWNQEQELFASSPSINQRFGEAVFLSDEVAVIGSPGKNSNTGVAYVFRYDGSSWVQEAELVSSDPDTGDRFGESVSISGNIVVVGARSDDDNPNSAFNVGAAYMFRYDGSNWVFEEKLLPLADNGEYDGTASDFFGFSVSISGDTAVIGSPQDDDNGGQSGSAYVFRYDGSSWIQENKLLADDGLSSDNFGKAVSIDGDVIAVGAPLDDVESEEFPGEIFDDQGSAYVFRFNGASWTQETKMIDPAGFFDDALGSSITISGNRVIVGSIGDDNNGNAAGSATVFHGIPL